MSRRGEGWQSDEEVEENDPDKCENEDCSYQIQQITHNAHPVFDPLALLILTPEPLIPTRIIILNKMPITLPLLTPLQHTEPKYFNLPLAINHRHFLTSIFHAFLQLSSPYPYPLCLPLAIDQGIFLIDSGVDPVCDELVGFVFLEQFFLSPFWPTGDGFDVSAAASAF